MSYINWQRAGYGKVYGLGLGVKVLGLGFRAEGFRF